MRLEDKVALLVGAGGKMATAVPFQMASEGASVMLAARRREPLEELARHIESHLPAGSGRLAYATGDATVARDCEQLVAATVAEFGRLDIVYCNVGENLYRDRPIEEIDEETWRFLIDINLSSIFLPIRAAVTELRRTSGTAIIVASAAGTRRHASPAYAAAKAGLLELTRNLALRLRGDGVRINCICPGAILPGQGDSDFVGPPLGLERQGYGSDIALAAVYLASNEAAWVTGQFLDVDGGAGL